MGGFINGHIGEYEIYVSADGDTFGDDPVVTGAWPDSGALKTADFEDVDAQALRLVALTEAPDNGPWTSAAEINVRARCMHRRLRTLCGEHNGSAKTV